MLSKSLTKARTTSRTVRLKSWLFYVIDLFDRLIMVFSRTFGTEIATADFTHRWLPVKKNLLSREQLINLF